MQGPTIPGLNKNIYLRTLLLLLLLLLLISKALLTAFLNISKFIVAMLGI